MKHWQLDTLQPLIRYRAGETKLGERIATDWQNPTVQYVLLGIEEDIGVRVNQGIGGTHTAWQSFLSAFANIQSTDLLRGDEIGIFGYFNFDDLKDDVRPETVEVIDNEVAAAIQQIVAFGKIPIVIGGGHNNAYPILKGCALAKKQAINAINLDAHADFRPKEGRHSGNGFRYAYEEGYLKKYAIIGLHQNYNAQSMINALRSNPDAWFCFWEEIFLEEKLTFKEAISTAISFTHHSPTGIELDIDSIENVLSSAMSSCGVSATQARQYVYAAAQHPNVAYLHLCEAATQLANGAQNPSTGKLLSYLVSDFVKGKLTAQ
jgi:formiminoglutamase